MLSYTKLHETSQVVNNLHEKRITESQDGQNFGSARVLFVICTCVTTLNLCYMKNALVFSQSGARNLNYYNSNTGAM